MTQRPLAITLGATALGVGIGWAIVAGYVVHTQLPASALRLPGQQEVREDIRRVLPQGWAFFTRSAREPRLEIWEQSSQGWRSVDNVGQAMTRSFGGWDRGPRARVNEAALVATSIPARRWKACAGDLGTCFGSAAPAAITNPTTQALLCGTVGLSRREPLPWAWAGTAEESMPVTVTVVTVTC
jgi:antimicrobial peptide system SdpA family protein